MEKFRLGDGKFAPVDAVAVGAFKERIINVCDVLHIRYCAVLVTPGTVEQVERYICCGVTHMRGVVRGDTADVQAGRFRVRQWHYPLLGCFMQMDGWHDARQLREGVGLPSFHRPKPITSAAL